MYPVATLGLGVVLPPGLEGGPDWDTVKDVMSRLQDRLGIVPEPEEEDPDDEDAEYEFIDEGDWPGLPIRMERYVDNICAYPTEGGWVAYIARSVTKVGCDALPTDPALLAITPSPDELDALHWVLQELGQTPVPPGPVLATLLEE